jgi:outer membrane lipoprotein SlyB
MNRILIACCCAVSVLLGGCARQISPNVYSEGSVGETSQTYRGTVISVRDIQVEGKEKLEENTAGMVVGGIGGALAGNQFGGGTGNIATTVLGGLAGATAGAFVQKELEKQDGIEYTVELEDGSLRTVVQGPNPRYSKGQRVLLMVYVTGRSRIVSSS